MKKLAALSLTALFCGSVFAQMTPVGTWVNIDDETKVKQAEITITESAGVLSGRITKRLVKGDSDVCDECTDDRKGKPLDGLEIMRGVSKDGDVWDGGTILAPKTGKIYKVTLTPTDGGAKLNVKGYISVLGVKIGRTQTWLRIK